MKKAKTVMVLRKGAKKKGKRMPKAKTEHVAPLQPDYIYAQVRLPKFVFNLLQRAAEIAEMDQTSLTLALVAVAVARAEIAGTGEVKL